ncbi:MAG: nucleotidyltransferase domain-containing protein [Aigarchaeota archaeon]|nr:nucleotidyltransferase domain-containing protein [Candidatus Pelearchaeum maunauluense]
MSDILREKLRRVEDYSRWVREKLTVRLLILFGSLAREDWTESSDIDILVVADELSSDVGENYIQLKQYMIEPIGYNSDIFVEEIKKPNMLILDALRYGRILYFDEEYLNRIEAAVMRVLKEKKIVYERGVWVFKRRV